MEGTPTPTPSAAIATPSRFVEVVPGGSTIGIGSLPHRDAAAAAQFSLDAGVAAGSWRLEASGRSGGPPTVVGEGEDNVEDDVLGIWSGADPALDHRLQTVLTDGLGRTLIGSIVIPGSGSRVR